VRMKRQWRSSRDLKSVRGSLLGMYGDHEEYLESIKVNQVKGKKLKDERNS